MRPEDVTSQTRRRVRMPLWVLFILPVVFAPAFLVFATAVRVSPAQWQYREALWVNNPIRNGFQPTEGEWAGSQEVVVKVARVCGPYGTRFTGASFWVTADGTIHDAWDNGLSVGGVEKTLPADTLAKLPALLRNLPSSDPAGIPQDQLHVAYPLRGRWVVRQYGWNHLPKPVDDLVKSYKPFIDQSTW